MTKYLSAKHILLEADFPLSWVSQMCAPVSRTYFYSVLNGKGIKNSQGLAQYTEADRDGLIQVANQIRSGQRLALKETQREMCVVCYTQHAGEC